MGFRISMLFLTVAVLAGYQSASAQANHKFNGYDLVDKTGNIRKPADYRDLYQLLGTYTVLDANPTLTSVRENLARRSSPSTWLGRDR